MKDDFNEHIREALIAVDNAALEPSATEEEVEALSEISDRLRSLKLAHKVRQYD